MKERIDNKLCTICRINPVFIGKATGIRYNACYECMKDLQKLVNKFDKQKKKADGDF